MQSGRRLLKTNPLSLADTHALAAFFALHHGAMALRDGRAVGPRNIERVVMATFGLCTKKGPFKLTPRGKRCQKLAQTEI